MEQKRSELWTAVSKASTIGVSLFCSIGLCVGIGYALDMYGGTRPWGTLIGGLLGGFLGLYSAIRQLL